MDKNLLFERFNILTSSNGSIGIEKIAPEGELKSTPPARSDFDLNPEITHEMTDQQKLRPAAVMIGLIERPHGLNILFTRRTDNLEHHPGQISFPGGHIDDDDIDATHAALRETFEETGIGHENINIIGRLDTYITGTGFSITPVVGLISTPFTLSPDPIEVAEIFEVPLAHFMDSANHRVHERTFDGIVRKFYAMPFEDYYIWGATAGMLFNLYEILKTSPNGDFNNPKEN